MMINKLSIQGKSMDGKVVWNGAGILWMMDSQGIPLEVIVAILRRRGEGFDVKGFIEAALQNKNFTPERIRSRLLSCYKGKDRQVVEDLIDECLEREKERMMSDDLDTDKAGQEFLVQLRCIDGKVKGTIWDVPPGLREHLEKHGPMLIGFRFHPDKIGAEKCSGIDQHEKE